MFSFQVNNWSETPQECLMKVIYVQVVVHVKWSLIIAPFEPIITE